MQEMGCRKQLLLLFTITIFNDQLDGVDEYSLRRKSTKSQHNPQLSSFIDPLSNISTRKVAMISAGSPERLVKIVGLIL